jgi:hypothetical protein
MLGYKGRRKQGNYRKRKTAYIPKGRLTFKSFKDKGQGRRG